MKLITIPVSHFCEKARWGLDRAGVQYVEQGYAPVVHRFMLMPRGSTTAPVLVDGRRTVRGSSAILEHCDRVGHAPEPLYPQDQQARGAVDELVAHFDARLGPPTRLWIYSFVIDDPDAFLRFSSLGLAEGQTRRLQRALPGVRRIIRTAFKIRPDTHEWCTRRAEEELALVSERLADGRPYLAGDAFTAADLTFAALAAPVLMPPEYGGAAVTMPPPPAELADTVQRWRETPAGRHGLAMYRERRAAA